MSVVSLNTPREAPKVPRVLAITGGKGGVGKTSISVNLAIALSRTGSKVCLFDADTGLANVNIMLGLYPAYTLEHLYTGEKSIQDIVVEGPEGIQIVPGASGVAQCVDLDVGQQQRLVTSIRSLEPHYDYMLMDTAAGISPTVLHFVAASQLAAIVITPEPTSLTDAFSLLKVLKRRGYRRKVQVIVNMASSSSQAERVFRRFEGAVKKYLGMKSEYLGSVWMDESMRTAVTLQRPVALFPKTDPSARSFYRLAERIDDVFSRPGTPSLAFSSYWQKVVERHASRNGNQSPVEVIKPRLAAVTPILSERARNTDADNLSDRSTGSPSPSQVERQLQNQSRHGVGESETGTESETVATDAQQTPLSSQSENHWVDLRMRMNRFFNDPNTTPEQVTTLLSSCIYSYGDRLGETAVDLLHGLLSNLTPDALTTEQKLLLSSDFERLGLSNINRAQDQDDAIEVDAPGSNDPAVARYDSKGFGSQSHLVSAIRQSDQQSLDNLLESIKYASLVESPEDK